ncbi:MAG: plasmid stabilization protein [Rothia sp. (in: high G+C Gram-positive bacteria)]|nr:plasmid stabilization protein [Rothia sp. (in: high G+C Gram-positive bacteria)]
MSATVGLLLDSDVLAEIRKVNPHPGVLAFLRRRSYRVLYISVLSLGELKGLYPYAETERWLAELIERFADHVLEIDAEVSLAWAGQAAPPGACALGSEQATPLPTAALEGLICATARVHQLEIVSAKAQIYRDWGVAASNPFLED